MTYGSIQYIFNYQLFITDVQRIIHPQAFLLHKFGTSVLLYLTEGKHRISNMEMSVAEKPIYEILHITKVLQNS